MHIIHGIYHLFPHAVAFRNDFCMGCNAPRRAIQIITLDIIHLYWVPVLPIGRWKRWTCSECGRSPDKNVKTRRPYKIAGLVILVILAICFWAMPVYADAPAMSWCYRIGAPIGAILTAINLAVSEKDGPGSKKRRLTMPRADDQFCPFCDEPLIDAIFECYCPFCGIKRL